MGFRSAVAYAGPDRDAPEVMRLTQLFHARPTGQFSYDFGSLSNAEGGGGIALIRSSAASDPIDLADALSDLGFALGARRELPPKTPETRNNVFIQPPPDTQDAAYAASMIAAGPEEYDSFSEVWRKYFRKSKVQDDSEN